MAGRTRSHSIASNANVGEGMDLMAVFKEQMDAFLKSDEFKSIIKASFAEALKEDTFGFEGVFNEALASVVAPFKQIVKLENELEECQAQLNDALQYSRKYNLIVHGIEEEEGEDCVDILDKICNDNLGIQLDKNAIDRAHRFGRRRKDKPKPIIVKFIKYPAKHEILRQKKLLKGTSIFINEDITKVNADFLKRAKNDPNVKSSWYKDGKVLARLYDDSIVRIRRISDFDLEF